MSLFPNTNTNTGSTSGGGLFGNTQGSGSSSGTTNIFGGSNFGAPPSTGGSLFANTSNAPGSSGNTGGSVFGSTPSTGTGGSILGGGNTSSTTPSTGGGLFGSTAPAASGTNAPTGGGSVFGGSGATTTPGASSLFGGSKPATSGSTSGTGTGSLFGGAGSTAPSGTGATPSAGSTSLFGGSNTAQSSSAPASGTTNIFGGGIFGQKPIDQAGSSIPKPATPSIFGQPASTGAAATSATTTAPSGGLFGNLPKPAEGAATTPAASTSTPAGGLFGGLFGQKPATPAPTTTTGPSTGPTLPSFSLGGTKDTSKDGAAPATTGLFGQPLSKDTGKLEEKKDGAAAPAPAFSLFGAKKDGTTAASAFTLGGIGATKPATPAPATTTPAVSVPPPSMLRGKTIEEIVNRWSSELETHVREFNKFAGEVAVWDRALIENGNNLAALYSVVLAADREQNDIDQSLDHIEQQQKDLSSTLEAYEKVTEEIIGGQGGSLRALDTGPADTERDKNYMLATELHGHLDDLSNSLVEMIESVNALSTSSGTDTTATEDPVGQIAQILSSHLESLQWIDGAVKEVESKLGDVERRVRGASESGGQAGGFKSRGYGLGR
ncbi:unnamed protein product [Somion occarium]|uniref:Nucleoporin NSP1-like C-terminal domain-containing protein n=1 Tax=Somion occarium TaxID=3059160 RepID=A0ABP1D4N8_9APHY